LLHPWTTPADLVKPYAAVCPACRSDIFTVIESHAVKQLRLWRWQPIHRLLFTYWKKHVH
jgi:hypothetical protein